MRTLDPMMDLVFKALFGKEDKTSKELLIALLNDILANGDKNKIVDISHLNPFNYKDFEGDKLSILDIKARTDLGEIINIEIQIRKDDNYRKRSLYYWAKSYGETILEAEEYETLKRTIVINILGYVEIVESEKLHSIFKIMEVEEHFPLIEDLEIHYLETPKLEKKEIEELNKVELWLEFLKEGGKEANELRLKSLMERSEVMARAINKLQEISADEKMREAYKAREKARLDMVSRLKYARREGREEGREEGKVVGIEEGKVIGIEEGKVIGIEEGRKQRDRELAKKLLADGLDMELVAKYTDLSLEEIKEIAGNIK